MDTREDWRTCKAAEVALMSFCIRYRNSLFIYLRDENGHFVKEDDYDIEPTEEELLERKLWLEREDRAYLDELAITTNMRRQLPVNNDVMTHILRFAFETY